MVDEDGAPGPEPTNLRFLRVLVSVLTGVMILGISTNVGLMIWKFTAEPAPLMPDSITLPDGVEASAVTLGPGWYAVVTDDNRILIYDRDSGALRQTVTVKEAQN